MLKHRGFPGRLPGTDYQFVIRRGNKDGATKIVRRERYRDRSFADRQADSGFMRALWENFGEEPFVRGNLDAGRLSWLIGREVVPAEAEFDPASYDSLLQIDLPRAQTAFPEVFAPEESPPVWGGVDEDEDDDEPGDEDRGGSRGRR